eukprot:m.331406 g.331406  ORF g.331406 m.331406 type:complete len:229 (-) comp20477_c0_seq1:465-1151(-)
MRSDTRFHGLIVDMRNDCTPIQRIHSPHPCTTPFRHAHNYPCPFKLRPVHPHCVLVVVQVRDVFRKARLSSPSIVFLDEVDAIVGNRDRAGSDSGGVQERVLATLLTEMDGIESAGQVLIVAATNRRDCLDKAFVRAGRIDRAILVPLPDEAARRSILGIKTRQMPLAEDVDLSSIASLTDGCSGADLDGMCREAAILAMRENILSACVCHRHFVTASRAVRRCSMSR